MKRSFDKPFGGLENTPYFYPSSGAASVKSPRRAVYTGQPQGGNPSTDVPTPAIVTHHPGGGSNPYVQVDRSVPYPPDYFTGLRHLQKET